MNTKGEQALSFLKELSFPRVSGSGQERQAAELIRQQVRKIGYEPATEIFSWHRNTPAAATLRLIEPEEKSWEVTGLIDAAQTPEEGIEAGFYYIKHIDEVSLRLAKDKFVLLNDRPGEQDYARLAKAGIRGFLLMDGSIRDTPDNSDLDTFRFREFWQRYGAVPGFTIRIRDALDLLKHNPRRVRFTLRTKKEEIVSQNIVVTVPGTDLSAETLAVARSL